MSARLLRLAAAALLAISPAAAAKSDPHFELDVVFPRNETYTPANVFPIAFAIQNMTALRALGDDYEFIWAIMPYSDGVTPGGITYDMGTFPLADEDDISEDDSHVFVAYTNATEWVGEKRPRDQYALQFYIQWPGYERRCGNANAGSVSGHLMFSVEAPYETEHRERWPEEDDPKVYKPEVKGVPECPEFGVAIGISADARNSTCPGVVHDYTGREKDPCAVVVDAGAARDIDRLAHSLAAEDAAEDAADVWPPSAGDTEDAENGVADVGIPGGVMAAACALGLLVIAW